MSRQLLLEHVEKAQQKKMHESQLNFFENIAHEFFTPLTLIYGPAQQLLERGELDNYAKNPGIKEPVANDTICNAVKNLSNCL